MKLKVEMVTALCREITLRKEELQREQLESVYFGGGTPSLLSVNEIALILETIDTHFGLGTVKEITLEANPDDIRKEITQGWRAAGINRLSIGVQSLFEEDLRWMNRAHSAADAERCIDIAVRSGFSKLTADLIYGFPLLTEKKLRHNLEFLLNSGIQHLSAYALTVEERTALDVSIKKGRQQPIDQGLAASQYELILDTMESTGWEMYEISNFCKEENYAVHNTNYWKQVPYLGIGPSAHSYTGHTRSWNIRNNAAYIQALGENRLPSETETLSLANRYNEYMMTSLRTKWGADFAHIEKQFGSRFSDHTLSILQKHPKHMIHNENRFRLNRQGLHFADAIAADFFVIEE